MTATINYDKDTMLTVINGVTYTGSVTAEFIWSEQDCKLDCNKFEVTDVYIVTDTGDEIPIDITKDIEHGFFDEAYDYTFGIYA